MKANEFVKKFGWDKAKFIHLRCSVEKKGLAVAGVPVDINELARLVESHELVGRNGGIESAKMMIERTKFPLSDRIIRLKRAIADVESCMEGV